MQKDKQQMQNANTDPISKYSVLMICDSDSDCELCDLLLSVLRIEICNR
jgi:hypothetical protein